MVAPSPSVGWAWLSGRRRSPLSIHLNQQTPQGVNYEATGVLPTERGSPNRPSGQTTDRKEFCPRRTATEGISPPGDSVLPAGHKSRWVLKNFSAGRPQDDGRFAWKGAISAAGGEIKIDCRWAAKGLIGGEGPLFGEQSIHRVSLNGGEKILVSATEETRWRGTSNWDGFQLENEDFERNKVHLMC